MIDRVLFLTGGSNLPPVFYYKKQLDIKKQHRIITNGN